VESEISEESTLYIAVCFESDFGNAVYLCDNEPLYVEFSTPGIALLHFFLWSIPGATCLSFFLSRDSTGVTSSFFRLECGHIDLPTLFFRMVRFKNLSCTEEVTIFGK